MPAPPPTVQWGPTAPLCVGGPEGGVYCLGATPAEGLSSLRSLRATCGLTALDQPIDCSLLSRAVPLQTNGVVPTGAGVPPSQALLAGAVVPLDLAAQPAPDETVYSLINGGMTPATLPRRMSVVPAPPGGCLPSNPTVAPLVGGGTAVFCGLSA